jgi:hypothetical protein
MDWKKELDSLVRETAELVERTAASRQRAVELPTVALPPPKIALEETPSPIIRALESDVSEREHIIARVQDFRTHQERMRHEREEFYSRTMQRARDLASGLK